MEEIHLDTGRSLLACGIFRNYMKCLMQTAKPFFMKGIDHAHHEAYPSKVQ